MTKADYNIGGIEITVNFLCPFFIPNTNCGSKNFTIDSLTSNAWTINIDSIDSIDLSAYQLMFKGAQEFADEVPYKWSLLQSSRHNHCIHFELENHSHINSGLAEIDYLNKTVSLGICNKSNIPYSLDPFFHPFGILLLQYIVHLEKGFILHASAIAYKKKGFLFTAISGTGKTTMAKLWQSKGASIINDDRIIVRPENNTQIISNTPMPYYNDYNKSVELAKLFIIKQSPTNYIKPLSTLQGTLAILGNCMQYQFDETQVKERLDYIEQAVTKCSVFEIGFKPDTSIVDLILENFG